MVLYRIIGASVSSIGSSRLGFYLWGREGTVNPNVVELEVAFGSAAEVRQLAEYGYPLLLEPIPVPKVWGGGRLARIPGRRSVDSTDPIGESWDVSTWPTAPDNPAMVTVTRIANGPLAGTPLDEVASVPVVVKVIDSAQRLSVQNHPVLPDAHKNEMWYILEADPGAHLFLGLKAGVRADEFCALLRSESPDEEAVLGSLTLHDSLKPGDHFNVPTGTVHAIGPGLLTFEISERSQVTYRLYDYNRERSRGRLDLEAGCAAVTAVPAPEPLLEPGLKIEEADSVETITRFPTFCVVKVAGKRLVVRSAERQHLVTATRAPVAISGPNADWNIGLGYSFTCLIPPSDHPYTIDTGEGGEVLISPLGDS